MLLETVKPGGLALAGTSWEEVNRAHPGLIVLTISDFGLDGPWSDFKANDLVALAVGGQMMASGYPQLDDGSWDTPPIAPQMHQSTHITGCLGAMDTLAALYWREHGGIGQRIDLSLHAAANSCTENWLSWYIIGGNVAPRRPQFPEMFTNDGKYMVVMLGLFTGEWERIVSLLEEYGMAEDLTDPAYSDPNHRKQLSSRAHIDQVIQTFLATEDSETIFHAAQRHGVIWAPIREPHDSIRDEHFFDRGNFAEIDHPELGQRFWDSGAPWVSEQLKWKTGKRAPPPRRAHRRSPPRTRRRSLTARRSSPVGATLVVARPARLSAFQGLRRGSALQPRDARRRLSLPSPGRSSCPAARGRRARARRSRILGGSPATLPPSWPLRRRARPLPCGGWAGTNICSEPYGTPARRARQAGRGTGAGGRGWRGKWPAPSPVGAIRESPVPSPHGHASTAPLPALEGLYPSPSGFFPSFSALATNTHNTRRMSTTGETMPMRSQTFSTSSAIQNVADVNPQATAIKLTRNVSPLHVRSPN